MKAIQSFVVDGAQLRVFGDAINPLFVAVDICKAVGIKNPSDALKSLAVFERTKIILKDDLGRNQETNCVNESGLYTLILRSRDAVKEGTPAYRFRLKVTSEILPAIRRTGKYETPDFNTAKITEYQQWELQKAVAKRAKNTAVHYHTIYRAIYNRFQIPRYTELKQRDFEDCIAFIEDVDLTVPTAEPAKPAEPELPLEKKGGIYLTDGEADGMVATIYYFRHLFRPIFGTTYQFLRAVNSPMQKEFYDAVHEIGLATLAVQQTLARHGHDIKKDESYQNLASHRDPDQGSYFKATDINTNY